jgi:hypothetical protein
MEGSWNVTERWCPSRSEGARYARAPENGMPACFMSIGAMPWFLTCTVPGVVQVGERSAKACQS